MNRLLAALLIGTVAAMATGAEPLNQSSPEKQPMLKAVIHVNFGDLDRQKHGLNNIENILKEVADAQIEVVCHGEGISLVENKAKQADSILALMQRGVLFMACENTMKKKSLTQADLLEGTSTVPSGAVEVIRKQSAGYSYFRP